MPHCLRWHCGDDGCGNSCGVCSDPTNCATFACEPTSGQCVKTYISCSETYQPVCGDDGLSYANTCQAECDGQTTVARTWFMPAVVNMTVSNPCLSGRSHLSVSVKRL